MSPVSVPSATPAALHDPTSAAYKKAARLHRKSTKNRPEQAAGDAWTPFRAAEKAYKARFPPPDLRSVLDLAMLDPARRDECARGGWAGRADAVAWHEIALLDADAGGGGTHDGVRGARKAYAVPSIPGARPDRSLRCPMYVFMLLLCPSMRISQALSYSLRSSRMRDNEKW